MGPYSTATWTVLLSHMHAGLNFHATTVSQSAQKKKLYTSFKTNISRTHIIPWLICCKLEREQFGSAFHKYNTSMDARTQSSLVGICFLNLSACKLGRKKKEGRSVICTFTASIIFTNNISQTVIVSWKHPTILMKRHCSLKTKNENQNLSIKGLTYWPKLKLLYPRCVFFYFTTSRTYWLDADPATSARS